MHWNNINEKMPTENTQVLVFCQGRPCEPYEGLSWSLFKDGMFLDPFKGEYEMSFITYWMDIPSPPDTSFR